MRRDSGVRMIDSGKTPMDAHNDRKDRAGIVFRGSRESADWALAILRAAGISASLAEDSERGGDGTVLVLVDAASVTRSEELLSLGEEESRRRIEAISVGLRRSALRSLVPALVVAAVEVGVRQRSWPDLLPWLVLVWGIAFVWLARRDYQEHWRTRMAGGRALP